jgi:hypothetical protein
MVLNNLFSQAVDNEAPSVTGEWFPISLIPDEATAERINIGVGLVADGRRYFRLIEDLRGFKCLYGARGLANIKDLIEMSVEHLTESQTISSPSSNIIIGSRRPASGNSPDEILSDLYQIMVPIAFAHNNDGLILQKEPTITVDNTRLRKDVFKHLRLVAKDNFERIIHNSPVSLNDEQGHPHELDLPILDKYGDHFTKSIYGSIVSAHYVSEVHRGYFLNGASTSLITASSLLKESQGSLFILMPDESTPGYNSKIMESIDRQIEKTTWPLRNRFDIEIHVQNSSEALAKDVINMMNALH